MGYHFQTELSKLGETNRKKVILVLEFMSVPISEFKFQLPFDLWIYGEF